jgi:hypothetical protein
VPLVDLDQLGSQRGRDAVDAADDEHGGGVEVWALGAPLLDDRCGVVHALDFIFHGR